MWPSLSLSHSHTHTSRDLDVMWCDVMWCAVMWLLMCRDVTLSLSLSLSLSHTHTHTRARAHTHVQQSIANTLTNNKTYSCWFRSARLSQQSQNYLLSLVHETVVHKMCCCSQLLPDTAASTLLRLLKPRLMQIFPHRDVDMWGVFEWVV